MTTRRTTRAATGARGAASAGLVVIAAPLLAVASVAGFVVQRAASDDAPATVELPDNRFAAPVLACPGGNAVDELHNGDRIFAIGVHDELDGWLLIRNPLDPTEHWYIESRWVTADAATGDLPEVGCDDAVPVDDGDGPVEIALPSDETTAATTTSEPDESTTTTVPGQTTTTQANSTPTPDPGPGPQPDPDPGPQPDPDPEPQPDPEPEPDPEPDPDPVPPKPTIGSISVPESNLWESYGGVGAEPCGNASSTVYANDVTNATKVTMSWSGPASGSKSMTHVQSYYQADLGTFPHTTIGDSSSNPVVPSTIYVTVTATGPGGSVSRTTDVTTLHDCYYLI